MTACFILSTKRHEWIRRKKCQLLCTYTHTRTHARTRALAYIIILGGKSETCVVFPHVWMEQHVARHWHGHSAPPLLSFLPQSWKRLSVSRLKNAAGRPGSSLCSPPLPLLIALRKRKNVRVWAVVRGNGGQSLDSEGAAASSSADVYPACATVLL